MEAKTRVLFYDSKDPDNVGSRELPSDTYRLIITSKEDVNNYLNEVTIDWSHYPYITFHVDSRMKVRLIDDGVFVDVRDGREI